MYDIIKLETLRVHNYSWPNKSAVFFIYIYFLMVVLKRAKITIWESDQCRQYHDHVVFLHIEYGSCGCLLSHFTDYYHCYDIEPIWPQTSCCPFTRCAHSFYSSIGQCRNTPMFAQVCPVVSPQIMYTHAWNMIEWIKQSFYLPSVSLCVRVWLICSCSLKRSVRIMFQTTCGHFSEREQTGEAFGVPQKMRHWSSESWPIRINLISMKS